MRAHHGSVAAAQRAEIEDQLKLGTLRGIVATSSLELGIDMGAVDLVVQIEAPLIGCQRHAEGGQREPQRRRRQRRGDFSQISRRPGGLRGRSRKRCTRGGWNRFAIRAIRWTCSRSRSSRWSRWIRGMRSCCSP